MSAYSDVNFDKDDEDAKTITGDDCSVISCDLESDVTSKKTVMTSDPPEDQFESDKEDAKDAVIAAANFGTEFAEALQSKIPFWNGEFSSVVRQWSKIESSVTHNRALIGQPCAGCETLRTGLNLTLQATAKFVLKAGIEPRGVNKNHVEKLLTNWCDLSDAVSSHCLDSHKDGLYRLDGHQSGCIDGLYSSLDEDEEPSTRHLFDRLHNTLNDPYHENPKYDQFGYASKIQTKAGLRIKAHKDSLAASTRVLKTMYDVNKTDRRRLRDLANLGSLLSGFADLR